MAANDNKDLASLKGLLFSDETQQLADIKQHLGALDSRVGDNAQLTASVSAVIAAALRQAEVKGHRELSQAISPLVVASIRREIVDSRDVMVEALYPITGRLVSSYVGGAIQKLSAEINARFDALLSPRSLMLRMRAAFTGKSFGDLMLAQNARFDVSQVLLVEANSGICAARWPEEIDTASGVQRQGLPIGTAKVDMISALLTAIMDFSREAFDNADTELRALNLGNMIVLLRRSPQYIVAAVGRGQVTPAYEAQVDEEFLNILDGLAKHGGHPASLLQNLHEKLKVLPGVAPRKTAFISPALVIFALLIASLAGYAAWQFWRGYEQRQLDRRIATIAHLPQLQNYPITIRTGDHVEVSGVAPNAAARDLVGTQLAAIFPERDIVMKVALVPSADDLAALNAQVAGKLMVRIDAIDLALKNLADEQNRTNTQIAALDDLSLQNLTTLRNALNARVDAQAQDVSQTLASTVKTTSQLIAERQVAFDAVTAGLRDLSEHLKNVEAKLDEPSLKLRDWAGQNAIQFAEGVTFKDDAAAARTLEALSMQLKSLPNQKIRLVGYADEQTSGPQANQTMSSKRAQRVAQSLIGLGVPADRLITVARGASLKISETEGTGSANRRVEFELATVGE